MNLILTICGAVAALIATLLMWWQSRVGAELAIMAATPTSKTGDAAKTAPGTLVELKAAIGCDAPLVSEFARQACVYYQAKIEREYERVSRDSNGRTTRSREREVVQNNTRHAPCVLDDGSGGVGLSFEGAKVEAIEVCNRFQAASAGVVGIAASLLGAGGGTTGHYYIETIIPPQAPVYVLGTIQDNGTVGPSSAKGHPFIVSHKSEEERAKDLSSSRHWIEGSAVVCFLIAAGLFVWAFIKGH